MRPRFPDILKCGRWVSGRTDTRMINLYIFRSVIRLPCPTTYSISMVFLYRWATKTYRVWRGDYFSMHAQLHVAALQPACHCPSNTQQGHCSTGKERRGTLYYLCATLALGAIPLLEHPVALVVRRRGPWPCSNNELGTCSFFNRWHGDRC